MPNSLRCMIRKLYFKGKITELEYHKLISKIDNRSERICKLLEENKPVEAKWKIVHKGPDTHIFCSKCWSHTDNLPLVHILAYSHYCPECGAKMVEVKEETVYDIWDVIAGSLDYLKEEINDSQDSPLS